MSAAVSTPGPSQDVRPVRRALVSVYDKTGLEDWPRPARRRRRAGLDRWSAALIESLGLPVTKVEDLTGFPECLEGRVKTLHPRVHAGILADTRKPDHVAQLADLGVEAFELVVVNLYPFVATVASGASPDEWSSRSTSAARRWCAPRPRTTRASPSSPTRRPTTRCWMPCAAAASPSSSASAWPRRRSCTPPPTTCTSRRGWQRLHRQLRRHRLPGLGRRHLAARRGAPLRRELAPARGALHTASGRTASPRRPSCTARRCRTTTTSTRMPRCAPPSTWDKPAVAIIKHANPCGIAVGADIADAHRKAHECDPVSAFGGIIAANRPVTLKMARTVADIFTEVIVAPDFDADALEVFTAKKNIRLLECAAPGREPEPRSARSRRPAHAARDTVEPLPRRGTASAATTRTGSWCRGSPPTRRRWRTSVRLAGVRAVKSNAIVLAKGGATVGIGMGQVNRVDSCQLAVCVRVRSAPRAVAASDAFFPFADGLQVLLDAGVARSCARWLDARRRGRRCRAGGRRHDVLHRQAALRPLTSRSARATPRRMPSLASAGPCAVG